MHRKVKGWEEREDLGSAGSEGLAGGGAGADGRHVELREDGCKYSRGQQIQALESAIAVAPRRHFSVSLFLVLVVLAGE